MEALGELERLQTRLLQRISKLELSHLPQNHYVSSSISTNIRLTFPTRMALRSNGVDDFSFKRVPSDYYDWPLESRCDVLIYAKVNTQAHSNVIDCSDRKNSKCYVVVVQCIARFNAEAVKNFLYTLNCKKKFNLRFAPEETSSDLTGFVHNSVTCIGMKTDIPVKTGPIGGVW